MNSSSKEIQEFLDLTNQTILIGSKDGSEAALTHVRSIRKRFAAKLDAQKVLAEQEMLANQFDGGSSMGVFTALSRILSSSLFETDEKLHAGKLALAYARDHSDITNSEKLRCVFDQLSKEPSVRSSASQIEKELRTVKGYGDA